MEMDFYSDIRDNFALIFSYVFAFEERRISRAKVNSTRCNHAERAAKHEGGPRRDLFNAASSGRR